MPPRPSRIRPWVEAGALLLAAAAIESKYGLQFAPFDPMALAVVLGGARFGYLVGAGVGLAAGIITLIEAPHGPGSALMLLAERATIARAFAYLALGALIGLVGDVPREQARRAKDELAATKQGLAALEERHELLLTAKEALDRRIVGQVQTVVSLYEAARELEALDPKRVLGGVLRLLARFLEVEAASIYNLEDSQLVLVESLGEHPRRPARLDAAGGALGAVARTGRPMPLPAPADDPAGPVLLAAPLTNVDGSVRAVLAIERVPFRQLTPATRQMVDLLADWGSRALANSEAYASAREGQRDHPVTGLHQVAYIAERLPSEWSLARRYKLPLSIILVRRPDLAAATDAAWAERAKEVAAVLKGRIRTIDVLGHHRSRDAFVLILPVTPVTGAGVLAGRLAEALPMCRVAVGSNEAGAADGPALVAQLLTLTGEGWAPGEHHIAVAGPPEVGA